MNRFNLYSRTEEEKTRDMIMYEKKATAKEICDLYGKTKKKADGVCLLFFCAIKEPTVKGNKSGRPSCWGVIQNV